MKSVLLALSLFLLLPVANAPFLQAHAQANSEADCEKLENAFAYNACLAELGPRIGERRSTAGNQGRPASPVQRRPDGRKAATFDVITGKK
jgi:hypothetical protein